jgi:ATPase family associated with various cellular activities (AAA)/Winged helix domain, variant
VEPNTQKILVVSMSASEAFSNSQGLAYLASSIAQYVDKERKHDLLLVSGDVLSASVAFKILESGRDDGPYGLILIGTSDWTRSTAQTCFANWSNIVIGEVDIASDVVLLDVPNPALEYLLTTLGDVVEQVGKQCGDRLTLIRNAKSNSFNRSNENAPPTASVDAQQAAEDLPYSQGAFSSYVPGEAVKDVIAGTAGADPSASAGDSASATPDEERGESQLFRAAIRWLQSVLREAGESPPEESAVHRSSAMPAAKICKDVESASINTVCGPYGEEASASLAHGEDASEELPDDGDTASHSDGDDGDGDCDGPNEGCYGGGEGGVKSPDADDSGERGRRPLLRAAIRWIRAVLYDAVKCTPDDSEQSRGLTRSREAILQALSEVARGGDRCHHAADKLKQELERPSNEDDPLAVAFLAFRLSWREFQLMVLALAPDLDPRFQLCIGYLQDDLSRRIGTLGLYCFLLGEASDIREEFAQHATLWRWHVFEGGTSPDEPLRLDAAFAQWLLGERDALVGDARARRALRTFRWLGSYVLDDREHQALAAELRRKLDACGRARWIVLNGDDLPSWRAVLELGPPERELLRVEPERLVGLEVTEVEDCAWRIARLALLTKRPVAVDLAGADGVENSDAAVDAFLAAFDATKQRAAAISRHYARFVRSIGSGSFEIETRHPLSHAGRVGAARKAARYAGAYLTSNEAEEIANSFPLSVDSFEQAMHLAKRALPAKRHGESPRQRFTAACRQLATEGLSSFAERIEPVFRIADVVLPADRRQQLVEIVDNVRLAPKVYDAWKFGEQLPYGRGVSALFFGPSGTGKTMAAMAIAHDLGVPLLRLDLSRIVSKYIGDTEKNIDRVFNDAQRSGSTILIDEADALLGKRSEVKDAHDRYANIEVAYVLQRMEAYEGLAILTSNMRQNMDAAFLRRLRFIVDFPRPDVPAREQIWRFCLPKESHELNDAAFRQLARKIDLTGGHIRQITLRAAFLAAAEGVRINLAHIAAAARAEFYKLGMPAADIDLNPDRRAA